MRRVNVIDPGDTSEKATRYLTIFYTGLYRALTFPRRIDEIDENGKMVHYSPYDPHGGVFAGPLVTDNGFWDTYRTVYPLLSFLYPDHLGVITQGTLFIFPFSSHLIVL
jgi:putative alpha-1,2-mannosidase